MATATASPVVMLEEAATKLRDKQSVFDALQKELRAATQEEESLKTLREKFLIPASAGDQAATAHVEEIEEKQLANGRIIEGLRLRAQAAELELNAAQREHIRISREIGEARAAARAKEISAEALRLAHNVQALYRLACRAEYDLSEYLRAHVEFGAELSERQRADVITAAREKLVVTAINEGWTESRCTYGRTNLVLRNACPPANLKHLEVLK